MAGHIADADAFTSLTYVDYLPTLREGVAVDVDLINGIVNTPYLTGDVPTLADLAAVGLSFNLRYPRSAHLAEPGLAGRGVPELVNDPTLSRFFQWRDEVYARFLK
jgi:glutathione S-transferase